MLETSLANPTPGSPGSGSSTDISLIPPYAQFGTSSPAAHTSNYSHEFNVGVEFRSVRSILKLYILHNAFGTDILMVVTAMARNVNPSVLYNFV